MNFYLKSGSWLTLIFAAIFTCSVGAQEGTRTSLPRFPKDIAALMKPLDASDVSNCGLTLFYPAMRNGSDEEIGPSCSGSYSAKDGTIMNMDYWFDPFDPEMASKFVGTDIQSIGLDDWLVPGKDHDTTFIRNGDSVLLKPRYSFGNKCNNLLRTDIRPITGSNWHGWIAEEVYGPIPKNKRTDPVCKDARTTPKNRCFHLVIGNAKMSAETSLACLLRKRTTDLEQGFSYDLFMEMIKTIHFNEE